MQEFDTKKVLTSTNFEQFLVLEDTKYAFHNMI